MKSISILSVFVLLASGIISFHSAPTTHRTAVSVGQTYCAGSTPCVLTYHNDNNRDGVNPHESVLQASTLAANPPTPRWMATADGQIYTQPLYIHQLRLNGIAKNVVYAATENDTVYAWDADSSSSTGTVLASVNFNNASDLGSGYTEIAVPYTDLPSCGSPNIQPEVGITGTPVIDASVTPPVMYVVSKHEDIDSLGNKTYRQKLHALAADTLQELPGSPVLLDAAFAKNSAPGFDPLLDLQRAGLALLSSGTGTSRIWVTWASHCDGTPHYGFAIEFTYNYTGTQGFSPTYNVFNTEGTCTNQPCIGGIWMGGAAPAVDADGNIYFAVGNGGDRSQGSGSYSNSIVRLSDEGFQDFYSPPDYDALNRGHVAVACTNPNPPKCPSPCKLDSTGHYCQITLGPGDLDLGSGGVVLLSPSFKLNHPELVAAGKQGMVYVAYADNLGHLDSHSSHPDQYSCTTAKSPAAGSIAQCFAGLPGGTNDTDRGSRGAPAFLSATSGTTPYNYLYFVGILDTVKAFKLQNASGVGTFNTAASIPSEGHQFLFPGASPSVSWNSAKGSNVSNAIVWALDTSGYGTFTNAATGAVVYAYKAIPTGSSLGTELWDTSAYNNTAPGNPGGVKFVVPTVADGKIFIAGGGQHYQPNSSNCPTPSVTVQPTSCGALTMFK